MIKRWLAIGVLAFAMNSFAHADEASKRAKVEELVTVMHVDKLTEQMLASMKAQLQKMTESGPNSDALTPAQKKAINDFEAQSLRLVGDAMSWQNMKDDFVNLYTKTFTEEEIDGMIAFYRSPSGQAVLTKMPQITAASMELVQKRMVVLQPQLKQLQDKFIEQMSGGAPLTSPPPPPSSKPKS